MNMQIEKKENNPQQNVGPHSAFTSKEKYSLYTMVCVKAFCQGYADFSTH